ncbi:crotonyl-CoA carboxylase/reductase [Paractinoplanes rishiriensis]|uniref:Crotonyl-CoA reductase n=1 Tax=Paractinoplanes rishiriensis TaxID=1050105 RepID=A0A919JZM5_9ACTN|nr:crotonyl-CoA carboxylase/reductase [Actinoplanes rishiriensis]GIE97633.1 crotonyl-CoA reductase [Actinoplanes rishiriensis]
MSELAEAVLAGASGAELLACPVPARIRAAHLRREDVDIFGAAKDQDRDVRRALHVGEVPAPELAPDEALIAVMASSINFNTVWSATFEPVPTFAFLSRFGRQDRWGARHDQPYHVIGSDASGVVVRVGSAVRRWSVGDRVVVAPAYVDSEDPVTHQDAMTGDQRAWGFETNFGGLADFAVVKVSQLMPKPAHLTWEESACTSLCASTAYRMLVSPRGAGMKQGDVVLIWGAAGGLGGYAVQLVLAGGGIPVAVVGSAAKADLLHKLGCRHVIDRSELPSGMRDPDTFRQLGRQIRATAGEDPHIVFEYTGADTFGASVYLARTGGTVVTCGSSSGYEHSYDNRYLWMRLKRIVGSHGANYQEAWEVNRLLQLGRLAPTLSRVYPLGEVGEATRAVQLNQHVGKVGVLCLAPTAGLGVDDPVRRAEIGEERLTLFRQPVPVAPPLVAVG